MEITNKKSLYIEYEKTNKPIFNISYHNFCFWNFKTDRKLMFALTLSLRKQL